MPRRRPPVPLLQPAEQVPLVVLPKVSPFTPEFVIVLLGITALGAVAFTVQSILSPFLVGGGGILLLAPFRERPFIRRIIGLILLLVGIWTFVSLFGVLFPFLFAYVLAYVFDPLATRLTRAGLPRWIASLLIVIVLVGAVVAALIFVLPIVVQQFDGIISGVRALVGEATAWIESGPVQETLEAFGVPAGTLRDMLSTGVVPRMQDILTSLLTGILNLLSSITSVALHVINAIIIPFLVFYLLKDFPLIGERFYRFFSAARVERARTVVGQIDTVLGRYLRGAVLVALIQGALSATVLWGIGVRYALVLGIMTAVLNFIPYLGLVTSLVVASIVALLSGGAVAGKVAGVVLLYLSQKLLEATVLAPKIIGAQVGLHPVVLILCLMVFGYFLGFIGLLIAVPATALLLLAWEQWERRRDEGF